MIHPQLHKDVQMTQSTLQRPARRGTYGALIVFALAYLGVMVVIFAPEGSFSSRDSLAEAQSN